MIHVKVITVLKDEVQDTAGRTVRDRLSDLGYGEVKSVRIGRVFQIEIDSADEGATRERVEAMCGALLANTEIESFEIVSLSSD